MSAVFTPQDWQLLSEYLDNRLSPSDKQKVEVLLRSSQTWHQNYQTLSATKIVLHSAPRRRAPRSFTITQAQAEQLRKPPQTWLPFRITSFVSTALAVGLFVFAIIAGGAKSQLSAAAPMMEMAVSQAEATQPPIIIWGPPGTDPYAAQTAKSLGMGGGGGGAEAGGIGGGAPADMNSYGAVPEPAMPMQTVPSGQDNAIPSESIPAAQPTQSAMMEPEAPQPEAETDTSRAAAAPQNPILGIQPQTGETAQMEPAAAETLPAADEGASTVVSLWIGATVLLIIGLISGYLSIRRKNIR